MNILFLNEMDVSPMRGGIDQITLTLGRYFEKRGHHCFLAYGEESTLPTAYSPEVKMHYEYGREEEQFSRWIAEKKIDIIVSKLGDIGPKKRLLPIVREVTRGTRTKVVACLHAMPGEELIGNSLRNSIYRICHGDWKSSCKDIALEIIPASWFQFFFHKKLRNRYRVLYDNADKVVLLSTAFYDRFAELGDLKIDDKFAAINSALTFNEYLPESEIVTKQKEVLILARMDEKSKRLSRALKIWKRINQTGTQDDWHLTVIGGGRDLPYFQKMAKRLKLKNISFEGRQEDALPYYRRSSIFMMTSAYEGWGLTLTESQQNGVVPMAFYSYASLPEIITDGSNGFIIPDRDIDAYTEKLLWLMDHRREREKMAAEAIRTSHRFTAETIGEKWLKLFSDTLEEPTADIPAE